MTYYWHKTGSVWELRQIRFEEKFKAGIDHKHDVCAIATSDAERVSMEKYFAGKIRNPVA